MSPVVGVSLLALLAVLSAAVVGAAALEAVPEGGVDTTRASLELRADAATDRLVLHHRGGDPLRVSDLRVRVTVDGEPLARQPPVPFFSARGFVSGPDGPFNAAHEGRWRAGERASVTLASTNSPQLTDGATVAVTVYLDDRRLASTAAHA